MEHNIRSKNTAYISTDALTQNYRAIEAILRRSRPDTPPQIISTVKANGYGHGVDTVTGVLGDAGCTFYAVSSEKEALEVRALEEARGRHPRILILGYTFPENAPAMAASDIECAAVSPEHARTLAEGVGDGTLTIHIKLDTGMHRVGFSCDTEERAEAAVQTIADISRSPRLRIGGIFTHFACCDDEMLDGLAPVPEGQLTEIQYARYRRVLAGLDALGIPVGLRHASNSAAILGYTPAWLDAVRAGIILYGMSPDGRPWTDEPDSPAAFHPTFCPAMQLETTVAHIQTLLPGEHVSYGATYTAAAPRTVATLPIGYADGWIRAYTGTMVRIGSREFPIIGRICMDQCMADITGAEEHVHVGDRVILFGGDRGESISSLAARAGTIVYECTCQVSARVPRVAVSGKQY